MRRFLFPLLAMAATLSAQEFRGTFSGTVTDATGSAVPKAKVVATEVRTGSKTTVYSETSGVYTIPFLPPGEYDILAEAQVFKQSLRHGLKLSAGDSPVVDIRLAVGAASESVTITADVPILETSSPTVGQVLSTGEIDSLPVRRAGLRRMP